MKGKPSRLESNKSVRQALARNSADLSQLHFSCAGRGVTLSGKLIKQSGEEFTTKGIEALVMDVQKIGLSLNSDLENWEINDTSISKKGGGEKKGPKKAAQPQKEQKSATE